MRPEEDEDMWHLYNLIQEVRSNALQHHGSVTDKAIVTDTCLCVSPREIKSEAQAFDEYKTSQPPALSNRGVFA